MFAEFDESEKPIVKIKLGLNIKDDEDYEQFTNKWLQLEDNQEEYHYIIDTTDCGFINIKYCYKIAGFIKSIKARDKKYLQKSIIIVNNKSIRFLLKTVFMISKPVSPVYIVTDYETANRINSKLGNNLPLLGEDYTYVSN